MKETPFLSALSSHEKGFYAGKASELGAMMRNGEERGEGLKSRAGVYENESRWRGRFWEAIKPSLMKGPVRSNWA
jgi:hypothetical protein